MSYFFSELSSDGGSMSVKMDLAFNGGSFDKEVAIEFDHLLGEISKNKKLSVLHLFGTPQLFCSGGNLKKQASLKSSARGFKEHIYIKKTLQKLAKLPVVKVAWIQGDVIGGGIELMSCFDLVILAPKAIIGVWQRRMGLTWGWGGAVRLLERVCSKKLDYSMLFSQTYCAFEAVRLGFADEVVDPIFWGTKKTEIDNKLKSLSLETLKSQRIGDAINLDTKLESKNFETLWWKKSHREALKKVRENQFR